jgi:hypothetical protein
MDPKKSPKINPTRKLKIQQKIQVKHHARPQLPREHGLKKKTWAHVGHDMPLVLGVYPITHVDSGFHARAQHARAQDHILRPTCLGPSSALRLISHF